MSRKAFGLVVAVGLCGGVALSKPGAEGAKPDAAAGERVKLAHEVYVKGTKELEELAKAYQRTGQGRNSDALAAKFYRMRAEADLAGL